MSVLNWFKLINQHVDTSSAINKTSGSKSKKVVNSYSTKDLTHSKYKSILFCSVVLFFAVLSSYLFSNHSRTPPEQPFRPTDLNESTYEPVEYYNFLATTEQHFPEIR